MRNSSIIEIYTPSYEQYLTLSSVIQPSFERIENFSTIRRSVCVVRDRCEIRLHG